MYTFPANSAFQPWGVLRYIKDIRGALLKCVGRMPEQDRTLPQVQKRGRSGWSSICAAPQGLKLYHKNPGRRTMD